MKKLVIIGIVFGMFFSACDRSIYPDAQFTVSLVEVQPGESIQFSDVSREGVSYFWDFDDGYTSTERNPVHYFDYEGDYNVTLTVTSVDGKTDIASKWIYVYYTVLRITAAEWNPDEIIDYIIPNAFVTIYNTLDDWDSDKNAVAAGITDGDGVLDIYPLDPVKYWVAVEATNIDVFGDEAHNWNFYYDNREYYLRTPYLESYMINEWTAWCDYFGPDKSRKSRQENYDLEEIKKAKGSFIIFDVTE